MGRADLGGLGRAGVGVLVGLGIYASVAGGCAVARPVAPAPAPTGPRSITLVASARDGTLYFQVAPDDAAMPIRLFRWRSGEVSPVAVMNARMSVVGLCGPDEIPVVRQYPYRGRSECRLAVGPWESPRGVCSRRHGLLAVVSAARPETIALDAEGLGPRDLCLFDVGGSPGEEARIPADDVVDVAMTGDGTTVVAVAAGRNRYRIGVVAWETGAIRQVGLVEGSCPALSMAPGACSTDILVWWSSEAQIARADWSRTLDRIDAQSGRRQTLLTGRVNGSERAAAGQLRYLYAFTRTIGQWTFADSDGPSKHGDTVPTAVCVVDMRDGSVRQLTSGKWADDDPIALAGDRVAYVRGAPGRQAVRMVRVDGTGDREIWSLKQLDKAAP
jgi:hypothetical protein